MSSLLNVVLPSLESIRIGGCGIDSAEIETLSKAPNLTSISCGGDDDRGSIRHALAKLLGTPAAAKKEDVPSISSPVESPETTSSEPIELIKPFPSLRHLHYPARSGTYNVGRGRNARREEYENPFEDELLEKAKQRGIWANRGTALEYKVEGAQRRAGFAAYGRRYGGW